MRETFLVGRVSGEGKRILWLRRPDPRTFPGPWSVRALLTGAAPDRPQRREAALSRSSASNAAPESMDASARAAASSSVSTTPAT